MNIQMLVFDAIFIFFVQFKYKKIIFSHYFDVLWAEEKFYIKKKKSFKIGDICIGRTEVSYFINLH